MCPRIIIHVDLDAFYAAVEERDHPEYKGKPVIIGADPKDGKGRGVVSTCNYEARRFGITSAMPISRAWKLCREAVFLPVNLKLYKKISTNIMKILKSYADKFEQVGIDEAFLDVSIRARDFEKAEMLAKAIKDEIREKERLTCSIGIGPNKMVAKIASDFQKPDGLTIVEEKDTEKFLAPLQVDRLWGIGRKTKARLNAMGIRTIGELASYDADILRDHFGVLGLEFHQMAQGKDQSEIVEKWTPKSYSREHTFEEDTDNEELIHRTVDKLFEEVIKDVEKHGFAYRTLTVKIRYEDFETHTRSKTTSFPVAKHDSYKKTVHNLLLPFIQSKKKIRLVGVKASNFTLKGKQKILTK